MEVAHVDNSMTLHTMLQCSWVAWVLIITIYNLTKVAEKTKTTNLTQPDLFVVGRATLPESSSMTSLDYPLLMLPTIHIDIWDARYTLQGIIAALGYPTDRAIPLP